MVLFLLKGDDRLLEQDWEVNRKVINSAGITIILNINKILLVSLLINTQAPDVNAASVLRPL